MTLDPGADAPTFAAKDQTGQRVVCRYDRPTVLYFYPRDDTPGCTTEAREFDDLREQFAELGVAVYGVSTDDVESHRDFADAHDLDIDLLADPDGNVAEAFGVPVADGAARRTTFVVVEETVRAVYEGVSPGGHAESVLTDLVDTGLVRPE